MVLPVPCRGRSAFARGGGWELLIDALGSWPNGSAAAPTAGLGALLAPLVAQLFAPARGRAASLDGCALPPLRKLPITGGLGADRRKPALGPSRGLGDA